MKVGTGRLFVAFAVALTVWLGVQVFGQSRIPHPRQDLMLAAAARAGQAFAVVDSVKRSAGLAFPTDSSVPWRALLGEDYTPMTTTLGSRAAKEVSTNPAWAALMVRWLVETGVTASDTVVVMASGSFPALALSALSAIEELGAEPVVMFSLGASSYGANVRLATLLDLESWVREAGILQARPVLVSPGGEDDAASGLSAEGRTWLAAAVRRWGMELEHFGSLAEAISFRTAFLLQLRPAMVINIGGGQAVLGSCSHAPTLPVGPWKTVPDCSCADRGVLTRIAAQGVPVVHLLNIRGLAALYGLDFEPGSRYIDTGNITKVVRPKRAMILAALTAVIASLAIPWRTHS